MKNYAFIALLLMAFSMSSFAQKQSRKDVPENVQSAFIAKFPDAQKVKWEMENESEWEAEFKWKNKEYSANFTTEGVWVETEYEIKVNEIPSNIKAIMDKNLTAYKIEEVEIAESASGQSYEMEISMGKEEFEISIDEQGNFTRLKKDNENDEQDED